ncbi:MAG TPA: CbiX/SirB N-terminal domain-containing protein [Actinopolymorphaceae bacterium]|jgi:sirohydrochlorin ferrochelatase
MSHGLLLVAHGSRDPRASLVAHRVAEAAGAHVSGLTSVAAFLELAEPAPEPALDQLGERGVADLVIQPFLLSNAYHSTVDLPEVARLARDRGWRVRLGDVLGPDDLLLDALAARLAETRSPYDAVVLAAAGSRRPEANATVVDLGSALGARLGVPVVTGFASAAEPDVGDAVRLARAMVDRTELAHTHREQPATPTSGAGRVAVATYLLAPGFFAGQIRLQALRAGATAVSEPLGARPEIVELVLRRAGLM